MIAVPGHTQGMMCVLILEERTILFGDACGNFVMLFDKYASTVEEYYESLNKLKCMESTYDIVLRNHGTGQSSKTVLDDVMECAERVLKRKDDKIPFVFQEIKMMISSQVDNQTFLRIDGKEGNLVYIESKIYKESL